MADGELDDELEQLTPEDETEAEPVDPTADVPEDDQDEAEVDAKPDDKAEVAEGEPEPVRQPTRGETRIQSLRNELRDRDTRLAETNRRIDELLARQQPVAPRETPEQRAARFAIMTPQEQIAETLRESEQRFSAQMNQMAVNQADLADRTAFQAKCAVDPLYAKWAPKVEGQLAELRTKGNNVEREVLMDYLMGKAMRMGRDSKQSKLQTKQAAQRVNSQRTRPANSGSDTQAQRRQQGNSAERRLENVQI